jgi:hypothetical protein
LPFGKFYYVLRSFNYFFKFLFNRLFSLLTRPFPSFLPKFFALDEPEPPVGFLTLSLSFPFTPEPPGGPIAILAFFFASLLATRSASLDFACFLASFERWASRSPRAGSPLGITMGTGVERGAFAALGCVLASTATLAPGRLLHLCTRSLRFANLSFCSSRASTSSTHSLSCISFPLAFENRNKRESPQQIGYTQSPSQAAFPCPSRPSPL